MITKQLCNYSFNFSVTLTLKSGICGHKSKALQSQERKLMLAFQNLSKKKPNKQKKNKKNKCMILTKVEYINNKMSFSGYIEICCFSSQTSPRKFFYHWTQSHAPSRWTLYLIFLLLIQFILKQGSSQS